MTTAVHPPRVSRCVVPPETPGLVTTLAPIVSKVGRELSYDVRLGVGMDPAMAAYAMSIEDDPVVLVVVNAMVPHPEWETVVLAVGRYHREDPRVLLGLTDDGVTTWQSFFGMPERWEA